MAVYCLCTRFCRKNMLSALCEVRFKHFLGKPPLHSVRAIKCYILIFYSIYNIVFG